MEIRTGSGMMRGVSSEAEGPEGYGASAMYVDSGMVWGRGSGMGGAEIVAGVS